MRLSIRTKILATYALLAILVVTVLFTGLSRLKRIGTQLNSVQNGYLPIIKTMNSLQTFFHLDETFDAQKILDNRNNRLFINSTTVSNPQWMEKNLNARIRDAKAALKTGGLKLDSRRIERIEERVNELFVQHAAYIGIIQNVLKLAGQNKLREALILNEPLQTQKRIVRSRIEFIARQLDERIRDGIRNTSIEERRAVFWTIGLTFATLFLATLIGFITLLALRPLHKLKQAAQKIAEGDLHRRVEISSKDEVGDLAREFNKMADSIEQRDEALRKQQEQLVQSEKMAVVGRMASKISHEVRNPLNALSLNVEMLEDEVSDEKPKNILQAMAREIDRLNVVAENYLSMARSKKMATEVTDLIGLIRNLEALIRPEIEHRKLFFEMNLPEHLPKMKIDAVRTEQALLNLLKNSMEALETGKKFGITVTPSEKTTQISIWDEGKGISKEIQEQIFEPFFSTKEKGTGLGLAITQEIIRDQGGAITCQSALGLGTKFNIELPLHT